MSGKHTLRRSRLAHCCFPLDLMISGVERHRVTHEDGSKEVAISSVDLLLDDTHNFILNDPCDNNCRYECRCRNGNLNKGRLWEIVLNELENTCISKTERVNKSHGLGETVYTVPVIGHKVFFPPVASDSFGRNVYGRTREPYIGDLTSIERLSKSEVRKIKLNPAQFMYWEGKYYDTTKVYTYSVDTNRLKVVGDCSTPKPSILTTTKATHRVEFTNRINFRNAQRKSVSQNCRIQHHGENPFSLFHTYRNGVCGWESKGVNDYLEINLGYPRSVTQIGTTGEFPLTTVFPPINGFRHGKGRHRRLFAPHVKILLQAEQALRWVTSYEVQYRHAVTNKWTLLCVTSANTDAFTEHILDLTPYFNAPDGLYTQYLRIKPLESHNGPVMRVAVYGVDPKQRNAHHNKLVDNVNIFEDPATSVDDVPTISYAIIHSSARAGPIYIRDSLPRYYKTGDCFNRDNDAPRAQKRKDFQGLLVDFKKTGTGDVKADYMHGIDYKNS